VVHGGVVNQGFESSQIAGNAHVQQEDVLMTLTTFSKINSVFSQINANNQEFFVQEEVMRKKHHGGINWGQVISVAGHVVSIGATILGDGGDVMAAKKKPQPIHVGPINWPSVGEDFEGGEMMMVKEDERFHINWRKVAGVAGKVVSVAGHVVSIGAEFAGDGGDVMAAKKKPQPIHVGGGGSINLPSSGEDFEGGEMMIVDDVMRKHHGGINWGKVISVAGHVVTIATGIIGDGEDVMAAKNE
jgi:hypothetical protein